MAEKVGLTISQVAEITPVGFATITWRYYLVYMCINFFLICPSKFPSGQAYMHRSQTNRFLPQGVYLFWPETSGRHLEEVDQIFRDSSNLLDPPKMAKRLPSHGVGDVELPSEKEEILEEE